MIIDLITKVVTKWLMGGSIYSMEMLDKEMTHYSGGKE